MLTDSIVRLGLDLTTGDQLQPYFGTVITTNHVLILYKQQGEIDVDITDFDGARDICFPTVL